jgi:pyridoxine 5-phosphate synthase
MTKLSVNINKVATIRNARGGNVPDLIQFAQDCETYGADGITIHPRPDERHITKNDVYELKKVVSTEFNIEGYPSRDFMDMVLEVKPNQVTLVPDPPNVLTSNAGWDTVKEFSLLSEIITELNRNGIRTSIFIDPIKERIEYAAKTGCNRIEYYTEYYAKEFLNDKYKAVFEYNKMSKLAFELGLGQNAGHDLNLKNLHFFRGQMPHLLEVSIGHAIISDALYLGIENVIQMYKRELIVEE